MGIIVHFTPIDRMLGWNLRVWQAAADGNNVWDAKRISVGTQVSFELPEVADPRTLQFKFHSTPQTGADTWEADAFVRRLPVAPVSEVWTFESSARILYRNPFPAGVIFHAGDVLSFQVITQKAFKGGHLYVWNPYDAAAQPTHFVESARDDVRGISTFQVPLASWMAGGFHLKLMHPGGNGQAELWEPDPSNRVWRPCDGASLWLKSGQCDVRDQPLSLTPVTLEVMYSAKLSAPPQVVLTDVVERSAFPFPATASQAYPGSPLFNIATYSVPIFPQASYVIASQQGESAPIERPFPATGSVSRFALGAEEWLDNFPSIRTVPVAIQPLAVSSFHGGVSVEVSVGNGPAYETVAAARQGDGTWQATANFGVGTATAIRLAPVSGTEPKPYEWIDTSRFCRPSAGTTVLHTTEGVYGVCERGATQFADPPNRQALMGAVFGAVVDAGVFASREMPQGANMIGGDIYFVVHAPHAVHATVILVEGVARKEVPMALTNDTFYWWCKLPAASAPPGTRYRFLLNDNLEVLDPAARAVQDGAGLRTLFGEDPRSESGSWSVVLDADAAYRAAHVQPWRTPDWKNFLIYEIHASRFTSLAPGSLQPLELLADELKATSRLGKPGYLRQLPVTTFGLMPVNEFSGAVSWGYDPSYYFAIDSHYGGASALAGFVNQAHANGRGVMLDVVFNHSMGSSLMSIAADVYRNGDYDGDRMNCGHPMVLEYFRQASIYLYRTFNLDGFRYDDTQTIVTKCQGGWEFLRSIRAALRATASAEGRPWPYCVAENSATSPWDISDPSNGVMDGQWAIDEVYRIRSASYDSGHDGWDDALPLKIEMDKPDYWGRPFYQATRFGESHDMVSGQDQQNIRIAARPPFGQGFQMAKALGTVTLLSNGIPMLFMGQEVGETVAFSFDNPNQWIDPQNFDLPPASATDQTRILAWFRQIMELRNDASKGLQGDANYQVVATENRTVAFTCGAGQQLFAVITFGTPDQRQNSGWLGLPGGAPYKEIFNSSWPVFQVESEPEQTNGGYDARIASGAALNLPYIGAVVLERA